MSERALCPDCLGHTVTGGPEARAGRKACRCGGTGWVEAEPEETRDG